MLKEKAKQAIEEALDENTSLFLIELEVGDNNQIHVVIDADHGISVDDCVMLSRKIEQSLDRDAEDFSLEVTSAGATEPLKIPRQFIKNIGRKLEVKTLSGEAIEAELVAANEENISLAWKAREPKPVGKGKHTVQKEAVLKYTEIELAKTKLKF